MKKKIFYGIAVLVVAAFAAYNVSVNSNKYGSSDVSLANVEALARGDNPDCPNGCLDQCGKGCFCYGFHPWVKEDGID